MFASVEDVIIHKVFASRPRDSEDVRSVIIKNADFEKVYVRDRLREFDRPTEKMVLLKAFDEIMQGIKGAPDCR